MVMILEILRFSDEGPKVADKHGKVFGVGVLG
jgi:hypothetical protein